MLYQLSYARVPKILAGCEPMLRERRRALPAAANDAAGWAIEKEGAHGGTMGSPV
jgi:hypothetical protein